MGRFRQKLYRFMYGRYGSDKLGNFLTYFSIVIMLAGMVVGVIWQQSFVAAWISTVTYFLAWGLIIWSLTRTFSRKIDKRRRENERYLKMSRAFKRFLGGNTSKKTATNNWDNATHIFRDCTKCGCTLRLPRRGGKHKVKCPRCSHSFYVKAKNLKF